MAKSVVPTEPLEVVGFYIPRRPVDQDGRVLNVKTGELELVPSLTKQSFKEECDINTIVKRALAGEAITHVNRAAALGLYEDLPSGIELQDALNLINQAEEGFMALPAEVRARFENDPVKFVDFVQDPQNQEELIKMGIAKDIRPVEAPPQKVEVVNPSPPPEPKK